MTVAVAVSGGVDSLLALQLLKGQSSDVLALHARFLEPEGPERRMEGRLARLCRDLGVELVTVDLIDEFRRLVIEPFVRSYVKGETPNPCALCNARIKFGVLLELAETMGAGSLATGHYAVSCLDTAKRPALWRGHDDGKEQSYFLSLLRSDQLNRACFPLGRWRKQDAVETVQRSGLSVPARGESQEVCFIRDGDYRRFLQDQCSDLPGPGAIVDSLGRRLGQHSGLQNYTLGQRRGLGIAHSEPLYVLDKRSRENELVVGPRRELAADSFSVRELSQLLPSAEWPDTVFVQTTYRQRPRGVRVFPDPSGTRLQAVFDQPHTPATPGQVAAFYSPEGRVLGAGLIEAPGDRDCGASFPEP
jgi:tRNA-specific 2-thiouridylase